MYDLATIKRLNDEAAQQQLGNRKGGSDDDRAEVHDGSTQQSGIAKDSATGRLSGYDAKRYPEKRLGERRERG